MSDALFPRTGNVTGRGADGDPAMALAVADLSVSYSLPDDRELPAVRGVTFDLARGEALGIVGETGSGKTSLVLALMGLLPTARVEGRVTLAGDALAIADDSAMRPVRWKRIALAFQGSASSFDPVYPVGIQVMEPLIDLLGLPRAAARDHARAVWERVGLTPDQFDRYPHQLSGGEKRRAMLAMAIACRPEVVLVDELTSGLDGTARAAIVDLLNALRRKDGLSLVVVSHNLADVMRVTDRTLVLYAGRTIEQGPTAAVLGRPVHPYCWGLVNAFPLMSRARDLSGIRGLPPDPMDLPAGCAFHPRCTQTVDRCRQVVPELESVDGRLVACHLGGLRTLLEVRGLAKTFSLDGRGSVVAVKEASLQVREGEIVALVGQTGSGKTTLAHLIAGLLEPDAGTVQLEGRDLWSLNGAELNAARRRIQLIFQDPFDAVSPFLTVRDVVREPLDIQGAVPAREREARAKAALADVRLPTTPEFLRKRAHELSGGQLQRVAIARALVVEPKLVVADEPISMLDVSEQAHVIRLLEEIQNDRGIGLLLISHDLGLVRKIADRIAVMHEGEIIEAGPADQVICSPVHPRTLALLRAFDDRRRDGDETLERAAVVAGSKEDSDDAVLRLA